MKPLTYTKPHHARKLHAELLAALPALRPVPGPGGFDYAVFELSSRGDTVTLSVPDGTDEAAVAAVVNAHTPAAPPPTPDEADTDEIRQALAGNGNLTNTQVKKALRLLFKQSGLERKV